MKTEEIADLLSQTDFMSHLSTLFQTGSLEDLARQSRFIERSSSRLSGLMFLLLNVCDFGQNKADMSLTEKCDYLSEHYQVEMSKQSLDERYNTYAVKFMRACFEQLFTGFVKGFSTIQEIHCNFSAIQLIDATSFQLPASLSHFYRGNGGDNSGSSIKIHLAYELLKGQILDFGITDGRQADVNYLEKTESFIKVKSLHIADLGYYCLSHLQTIVSRQAYFLSRYKANSQLYLKNEQGNFEELNLFSLLAGVQNSWDLPEVYVGKKERLLVRLVIERLPKEVKEKRLKKLKAKVANQSKKGRAWQSSQLKEFLCGFNLFITNATPDLLSKEQVGSFYSLRWQIELLFKIWKSILSIDKIGQMSIFRFECLLYGRLIALLVSSQIQAFLRDKFAHDPDIDIELSEWKAIAHIKKN
jgi:hypothetical protein